MVKKKICKYYRGPKGCKNGDNCKFRHDNFKFRHQEQDPELSTAAFFSATSRRISPIKEEDPTPTSSINHDFNSDYDWPLLRSNGTIRPIKQEHPATTSKGKPPQNGLSTEELSFVPSKPPQDSSTAASPFANTDGSPQDDRINVSVPSSSSSADKSLSRKYVDALKENIDASAASATNETIPPIKQEYPQKGMNRSSLERGMFRTEHIRSYKEALGKKAKFEDAITFGKTQSKIGRVDSLDDDGFPFVGANLQSGDIVIGKFTESGADHSIKLKHTERGMVQKVVLSANDEGKNFAVVSLRQVRSPCLGDKFSSMHGQKGVLGFLESQENFPFTSQGIVPDIVINPHAFPSRQTPGQMLEAALGKGIALGGSRKYATPFSPFSVDAITDQLHRAGFSKWGNERVYSGQTGEMIKSLIFMGPTFYQRLIHMSEDKVKYRNTGPVHPLTRQPVSDRKRFGGIKFGEMERDCLIAHGASANLHERLFTLSDSSQMHICRKCRNMVTVIQRSVPGGRKIRGPYCRFCESVEEVVKVYVPYGAKLLCQELFSMGICLKFDTELC